MNNDLKYYSNCVIKKYEPNAEYNNLSSLDNELFCFNKFYAEGKNPYCPIVFRMDNLTHTIERFSFELGDAISINKNNVKSMFFSISYEEFEKQIDEILSWLEKVGLNHRDFNPSNLIFYEKEKRKKLIDFYWAKTNGIDVGNPGQLNWFYGKE
jgi:serine/threonine protein kinase